jgi:RNA polymerase sigma-70 factor (ECF subfamily)
VVSDKELIERFLGGERAAFDELVVRHREQVFATAYRMVSNAETAEEIAQETFIKAFRALGSFKGKAGFNTWLYRITMNLCHDEFKKRSRRPDLSSGLSAEFALGKGLGISGAPGPTPGENLEREESRHRLERFIEALPFKQRSTLTLRVFREMSFREIGQALGCSAGSARVNYRHAVLRLRESMGQSGEDS